jgi:phospholipase C
MCKRGVAGVAAIAAALMMCLATSAYATPSEGIHNIKHVIMIMQENRSFDSYFGTYPGADGIPAGTCLHDPVNGGCDKPFHESSAKNFGGAHGTHAAVLDINGGAMNGFVEDVEQEMKCSPGETRCLPCSSPQADLKSCADVMGYHDAREIPNYWTYASDFVLHDNMYEPVASMSLPSHVSLVSGWSAKCPEGDANPMDCVTALSPGSPPRNWTDITFLLHKAQVSWRYYVAQGTEPDCENDEALACEPKSQGSKSQSIWNPLPSFTDVHQDGQLEDIQSLTNFYTAVHSQPSCGLPSVSWIAPSGESSEHPPNPIGRGQAYVTTLVNSVMRSPCWSDTAIFVSWDDWGGFYDHVVPPPIDKNGYGLRVPSLLISAYAKTGYIDHQQLSFDAYLKFIEDDFLAKARLNPATDGRPDARPSVREEASGLGDLANDFDFSKAPRAAVILSTHPEPGQASKPPG